MLISSIKHHIILSVPHKTQYNISYPFIINTKHEAAAHVFACCSAHTAALQLVQGLNILWSDSNCVQPPPLTASHGHTPPQVSWSINASVSKIEISVMGYKTLICTQKCIRCSLEGKETLKYLRLYANLHTFSGYLNLTNKIMYLDICISHQ